MSLSRIARRISLPALLAVLFLPAQPAAPTAYHAETAERARDSQTYTHPPTTATSPRPEIGRPDI